MLPGIMPTPVNQVVTSVSFLASATDLLNATGPLALPGSARQGDIVILVARDEYTSAPAPSAGVPSGYTLIGQFEVGWSRYVYSHKVLSSGEVEIPAYTNSPNPKAHTTRIALVFRPNAYPRTLTPAGFQSQATNDNPSAQIITSGSGTSPLIVVASWCNDNGLAVSPRSSTPAMDGEVNFPGYGGNWFYAGYKIYNSSPANVTVDMDDEGFENNLASFYIAIR